MQIRIQCNAVGWVRVKCEMQGISIRSPPHSHVVVELPLNLKIISGMIRLHSIGSIQAFPATAQQPDAVMQYLEEGGQRGGQLGRESGE